MLYIRQHLQRQRDLVLDRGPEAVAALRDVEAQVAQARHGA